MKKSPCPIAPSRCFSLDDSRDSYTAVTNWLTDARTLASPNIVIILCGNKKDLEDQRQVTQTEASQFAKENGRQKPVYF